MIKGIDVSSFQDSDFVTAGLDFAWIKATEGTTYINPKMNAQAYTSRHAGLVTGFYHFLRPGDISGQVEFFVERCASIPGDLLALDWEVSGISCEEKDAALKTLKRLRPKHRVILYCNKDFWLNQDTTSYCADGLWIADPDSSAGRPKILHHWTFHQYGIRSATDQDVANFSSRTALSEWCRELL